ncbi:MAG: hypothetical protein H0W88_04805 [Parachlamydiaceae bacterium]|nr:hypothetical protein [Parachlamydiaceae bacterium]
MTTTSNIYSNYKQFKDFSLIGNCSIEEAEVVLIVDPYEEDESLAKGIATDYCKLLETVVKTKTLRFYLETAESDKGATPSSHDFVKYFKLSKTPEAFGWKTAEYIQTMKDHKKKEDKFAKSWEKLSEAITTKCKEWKQQKRQDVNLTQEFKTLLDKVKLQGDNEDINSLLDAALNKYACSFNDQLKSTTIDASELAFTFIKFLREYVYSPALKIFSEIEINIQPKFYIRDLYSLIKLISDRCKPEECLVFFAYKNYLITQSTSEKAIGLLNKELAKHKFVKIVYDGDDLSLETNHLFKGKPQKKAENQPTDNFKEEKKEDSSTKKKEDGAAIS